MAKKKPVKTKSPKQTPKPTTRTSQGDIPSRSLRESLIIAQAITDSFGGHPTAPHQIAMALSISPTSSNWRFLTGASSAYGLTAGGYATDKISLTEIGRRATAPTTEGDDIQAKAEAALKPKTLLNFFEKYNKSKFPSDQIAKNVLQHEFNVQAEKTDSVLRIIKDNGAFAGFIHDTKTGPFVATDDLKPKPVTNDTSSEDDDDEENTDNPVVKAPIDPPKVEKSSGLVTPVAQNTNQGVPLKVFLSHGKNLDILEQVKAVLELYDIDYEVAVEEETTAIPVAQKVVAAMRRCNAGVMIVTADEATNPNSINNNVLIEIGAAFVLYDQKVILLWDKSLKVPSNLQGLYRCEFEGSELSFAVGTKLSRALKGFKK